MSCLIAGHALATCSSLVIMDAQMARKFGLTSLGAALLMAFAATDAPAAALGRLNVLSSLEQPLVAEIEVTGVAPGEATTMIARLASPADFRDAGLDLSDALRSMHFTIETKGGRSWIKITSVGVINEPLVDLLLELRSVNGRMVREYNFLLDPPSAGVASPVLEAEADQGSASQATPAQYPAAPSTVASVVAPKDSMATVPAVSAPAGGPLNKPAVSGTAPVTVSDQGAGVKAAVSVPEQVSKLAGSLNESEPKAPGSEPVVAQQSPENPSQHPTTYRVRRGDSLVKIAAHFKMEGVSREQMLVALYSYNPTAFINGNMDLLKATSTLSIPEANDVLKIDQARARKVLVAKSKNFDDYRHRQAVKVTVSAPVSGSDPAKHETGSRADLAQEIDQHQDALKLSAPKHGRGNRTAIEDQIAHEKAMEEANGQVKRLESYVRDLKTLVDLQNKQLSERQH